MAGVILGWQIRAARACLRWTVPDLHRACDVSEKTIWRLERFHGLPPNTTTETLIKIRKAFEREGLTFLEQSSAGGGIRYVPPE